MQNSDFWTRITSLNWYHTSPVVLCMQTSVIRPRITFLCGSQPSSLVFGCKTARITSLKGSQTAPVVLCMQTSVISPRKTCLCWSQPSSLVCGCKTARITSLYGSQTTPVVFPLKTARLAPDLLVSMGPCPHLWFLPAKQELLAQNYMYPLVPDLTCRFVHEKQRD